MSLSRNMKTGDRLPAFNPVITDDNGALVDLSAATCVVNATQNGAALFAGRSATGGVGTVTMAWNAGDTSAVGAIYLEVVATIGGLEWTFPSKGTFVVNVHDDL